MQKVNFKELLIAQCKGSKIEFEIKDNEFSVTMDDAINQRKLTQICDSWYSDHDRNRMVFLFDTGLVHKMTNTEFETYTTLIFNMPPAIVTAQYGVKNINNRNINGAGGYYITFVAPEDAFNMSFLIINKALDFDDVTG